MSGIAVVFLVCGLLLLGELGWGLGTGSMLSRFSVENRDTRPFQFWMSGAFNAMLAIVCFYMAWTNR